MDHETSDGAKVEAPSKAWPRFLDPHQASDYLRETWGLSYTRETLAKLRWKGGGAQYRKAGKAIRYTTDDLDRWAHDLLGPPLTSTGGAS